MKKITTACVLSVLCVYASSCEASQGLGMKRPLSGAGSSPVVINARTVNVYNIYSSSNGQQEGLSPDQLPCKQQKIADKNLSVNDIQSMTPKSQRKAISILKSQVEFFEDIIFQGNAHVLLSPETSNGSNSSDDEKLSSNISDEHKILNESTCCGFRPNEQNDGSSSLSSSSGPKAIVIEDDDTQGKGSAAPAAQVEEKSNSSKIQPNIASFFQPVADSGNGAGKPRPNLPRPDMNAGGRATSQGVSTVSRSWGLGTGFTPAQLETYNSLKNNQSCCVDLSRMLRVNFTLNIVEGLNENSVWKQIVCPSSLHHLEGVFLSKLSDKDQRIVAIKADKSFLMDFSVNSEMVKSCQYSRPINNLELHAIVLPYNVGNVDASTIEGCLQATIESLAVADSEKGSALAVRRAAKEQQIRRQLNAVILRGNAKLASMPLHINYVIAENKGGLPNRTSWYHGLRNSGADYWMAVRK